MKTKRSRSRMKDTLLKAIALFSVLPPITYSKTDGWYRECKGDECGSGAGRGGSANCKDLHAECKQFALQGECRINPPWMHTNCRRSCGLCLADELEDEPCDDLHTSCSLWASELECFTNPGYMTRACRKSCWFCVNKTSDQFEGLGEDEIQRRTRYSQTDFGLWQSIPEVNGEQVRQEILKMARYAMKLDNIGPGTLCNNLHHECAQWVVEKGSCEADLDFMLSHCSLACQYCDRVDEYHSCRRTEGKSGSVSFGDLAQIQTHLFHEKKARNLLDTFPEKLESGEWIFSLDYSDFWKDPTLEMEELMRALKSEKSPLEWTEASAEMPKAASSDSFTKRTGKVAKCDFFCQEAEPAMGALIGNIADLLQIKPEYLQPLEFVHYQRGERFSAHHDNRAHDSWRHSGNRVLTVFISLQKSQSGGSFGFPDYDWMLIEQPQILVWPNVMADSPTEGVRRMRSEQLPVVDGDMFGVYATLRQYPYDSGNPCS